MDNPLSKDLPFMLTVQQVADILNIGRTTVFEMYHADKLIGPRVGKKQDGIRILRSSLEEFIRSSTPPAPAPAEQQQPPLRARRRRRTIARNLTFKFLTPSPMNPPS